MSLHLTKPIALLASWPRSSTQGWKGYICVFSISLACTWWKRYVSVVEALVLFALDEGSRKHFLLFFHFKGSTWCPVGDDMFQIASLQMTATFPGESPVSPAKSEIFCTFRFRVKCPDEIKIKKGLERYDEWATAFHQNDLEMQHFEVAKMDVACPFNRMPISLGTYTSHTFSLEDWRVSIFSQSPCWKTQKDPPAMP